MRSVHSYAQSKALNLAGWVEAQQQYPAPTPTAIPTVCCPVPSLSLCCGLALCHHTYVRTVKQTAAQGQTRDWTATVGSARCRTGQEAFAGKREVCSGLHTCAVRQGATQVPNPAPDGMCALACKPPWLRAHSTRHTHKPFKHTYHQQMCFFWGFGVTQAFRLSCAHMLADVPYAAPHHQGASMHHQHTHTTTGFYLAGLAQLVVLRQAGAASRQQHIHAASTCVHVCTHRSRQAGRQAGSTGRMLVGAAPSP